VPRRKYKGIESQGSVYLSTHAANDRREQLVKGAKNLLANCFNYYFNYYYLFYPRLCLV
jgi:hypothetical protein